MGTAVKRNKSSEEEFILMRRTRALLSETWELWRESFEQSPAIAKRVLTQGLTELHKAEKEIGQKAKSYAKKPLMKKTKAAVGKKTKKTKKTKSRRKAKV